VENIGKLKFDVDGSYAITYILRDDTSYSLYVPCKAILFGICSIDQVKGKRDPVGVL